MRRRARARLGVRSSGWRARSSERRPCGFGPRYDPFYLAFVLLGCAMGIGGGFAILIYVGKIVDHQAKQKR